MNLLHGTHVLIVTVHHPPYATTWVLLYDEWNPKCTYPPYKPPSIAYTHCTALCTRPLVCHTYSEDTIRVVLLDIALQGPFHCSSPWLRPGVNITRLGVTGLLRVCVCVCVSSLVTTVVWHTCTSIFQEGQWKFPTIRPPYWRLINWYSHHIIYMYSIAVSLGVMKNM